MEQIREGVSGGGLEGNSWEEGLTIPTENGGVCLYCIFKVRANKRFVQEEENIRGQGSDGSL